MRRDTGGGAIRSRLPIATGAAVAAIVLAAAAVPLLGTEGSPLKALVAVWLAALPLLGTGALVGWLLGRALVRGEQAGTPAMAAPSGIASTASGRDSEALVVSAAVEGDGDGR